MLSLSSSRFPVIRGEFPSPTLSPPPPPLPHPFTVCYSLFPLCFLVTAAMEGHLEVMKELLNAGAAIDAADSMGDTAVILGEPSSWPSLPLSCSRGVFSLPLSPLHLKLSTTTLLLSLSLSSSLLCCSHSLFVLLSSAASAWGKTEIVIELLHRGARIDAVNKNGSTALHWGPIPHSLSLFASLLCCLSCCLSERRVREGGGRVNEGGGRDLN